MIKVFNFNNSLKYIKLLIIIALLIVSLSLLYNFKSFGKSISSNCEINTIFYSCFNDNLPGIDSANTDVNKKSFIESILSFEIPVLDCSTSLADNSVDSNNVIANSINCDSENEIVDNKVNNDNNIELASDNLKTEIVPNNVPNKYTNEFLGVQIRNETNYTLDENLLNLGNLDINKNNVLIFHTHTCESYTKTDRYQYNETGNFRTTDLNRSVAMVGNELSNYLVSYGFNVTHDTTYHDYPSYNGSYGRSMATVENLLKTHSDTDIIIDLHRDAIGDTSYAPCVKIGNDTVSQLMFVLGTDGGGLEHPNWKNNLKFAIKVQQKANDLYPGLFKPIILRNSRYNQQLGKAACIIEDGATGNTLDQSLLSMKYFSNVLDKLLKE